MIVLVWRIGTTVEDVIVANGVNIGVGTSEVEEIFDQLAEKFELDAKLKLAN